MISMCKVLAGLVFAGMFCLPDVLAEEGEKGKVIAMVYGREITAAEGEQVSGIVMRVLRDQFCQENGIEATSGELEKFVEANREGEKKMLIDLAEQRTKLTEELKDAGLTEEKRKAKEVQLESMTKALEGMARMKEQMKGQETVMEEARKRVGREMIRNWKFNQALFQKYGGRVIYQQGGQEPLDAMREFLKEEEEKESFVILDSTTAEKFWKYFVTDSMHTFVPAEETEKLMNSPWWEAKKP